MEGGVSMHPDLCLLSWHHYFLKLFFMFFFVILGLCCCTGAFSSCGEWDLLFTVGHGLLVVVISLVAEHWL